MAKRFKMKFTLSASSFQLCRSKDLSSFPGNPVPAIYRLSPVNSKAHHIEYYPSFPAAPPETSSPEQYRCKIKPSNIINSSKGRKSTSSVPSSRRSTNQFVVDCTSEQDESETLISCLTSISDDDDDQKILYSSSGTVKHVNKIESSTNDLINMNRSRKISSIKKIQSVRFHSTMENRRGAAETKTMVMSNSSMEEKVRESFAVVRKSKDPYGDFKKSMVEMIQEMEMSEAKELEQLLQCFLALYSQSYHAVIVRAFMEIWQEMFDWNRKSIKMVQTDNMEIE